MTLKPSNMPNYLALIGSVLCVIIMTLATMSVAQAQQQPAYHIKPSEVTVPPDVPMGKYRRFFQPFENWTLICDDNLETNERVCNISQIVVNNEDETIFSWSLGATPEGQPYMLLRPPANSDTEQTLDVYFEETDRAVFANYRGCDQQICLALLGVGPVMMQEINSGSQAIIRYSDRQGQRHQLQLPLHGLKDALGALLE